MDVSDYTSSAGEDSCDTVIYVGPNGRISDQDLTDNEGPPIENEIPNDFSLSEHAEVSKQPIPFLNKKVNIVKPMTSSSANDSASDNNEAVDSPATPVKIIKPASKGKSYIGDFIVSDCEETNGRRSPCFGPRFKPIATPIENENNETVDCVVQTKDNDSNSWKNVKETELSADDDDDDDDEDDEEVERIDLCSAIKSSRNAMKYDINANKAVKEEDVIEVFVEDDKDKVGNDLDYTRLDETSKIIVSEIISKTRPKGYFHHEADDEDLSYLHMGPVTEKELRKSERRIKKLLKGGLVDNSHVHAHSAKDDSYLSECETGQLKRGSPRNDSSGYSSAPETENRRRRLQKIFTKSLNATASATNPNSADSGDAVIVRTGENVTSPTKRLSAEETRSLLKDFVAKKIEERALSPERDSIRPTGNADNDMVDQNETFVASSYAQVKYVPTGKANITSTRLCRGSFSSVLSSEANSFSPPSSETSYDKADTISMASFAGSEDRNEVAGLCSPSSDKTGRRRRSPVKIHYRWSTVFEEEEKSKLNSHKAVVNTNKQTSDNKKTKSNKKTELSAVPGPSKTPKNESKVGKKSPKLELKRDKSAKVKKEMAKSPNISKSLRADEVGSSSHSVSGLSELSESSGVISNDNSSLSQQSFQSSPIASMRNETFNSSASPISPRTRRWFFR